MDLNLSLDDGHAPVVPASGQPGETTDSEVTPPRYSAYPYRLHDLFQSFTNKWIVIGSDCVVLIGDHLLNNPHSLASLADNSLQLPRETIRHLVGIVIAFHREYPERSFLINGIPCEIDPAIEYEAGTSPEAVFLCDALVPSLRDAGHSYLVRVGTAINKFLQSDAASAFLLSLQSGQADATEDLRLSWSDTTGYPFWHDLFPDQTVVWFANVVVRDFLFQTLSNGMSDIWVGFVESPSYSELPVYMHPVQTCRLEKASFVLAWFIVEIRALKSHPSPSDAQALTPQRVRMIGNE